MTQTTQDNQQTRAAFAAADGSPAETAPPEARIAHIAPGGDGVAAGLFTVVAGALGIMAVLGEVLVEVLPFVVVFAGLGFWAMRTASTRVRWAVAGLMTLFVGVNLLYAIGDLAHPESSAAFIATAVVIGGGVVTIVLAVLAARGRPAVGRRVWAAGFAAIGILAVISVAAGSAVKDDAARPGDVTVVAENFAFPDELQLESGTTGLLVDNVDRVRHNISVEGHLSPVELPADSQVRVEVDLDAGEYQYLCTVTGHENMRGTLLVR
ncbi:MAG: cupredoxin domain-containing protein [Microthrixaceae bacterium]